MEVQHDACVFSGGIIIKTGRAVPRVPVMLPKLHVDTETVKLMQRKREPSLSMKLCADMCTSAAY